MKWVLGERSLEVSTNSPVSCRVWFLASHKPIQQELAREWTSSICWGNNASSKSLQEQGLHTLVLNPPNCGGKSFLNKTVVKLEEKVPQRNLLFKTCWISHSVWSKSNDCSWVTLSCIRNYASKPKGGFDCRGIDWMQLCFMCSCQTLPQAVCCVVTFHRMPVVLLVAFSLLAVNPGKTIRD